MQEVTIGGERLGSGAKMRQPQPHYNRSNHDLGYIWKNSQAVETITFYKEDKAFGITYLKNKARLIAHVGLHVIMEENEYYEELFKKANELPFSHEMLAAIMSVYDIKHQNENNQNK